VFGWPVPVAGADFVERSTVSWLALVLILCVREILFASLDATKKMQRTE